MARKGDRSLLEPLARKLYADGKTLQEISEQLGVSVTSLSNWKNETLDPSTGIDEWDRSRHQKGSFRQRMRDLYDRHLELMEGTDAEDITSAMTDTLSKLGALVERFDKLEATREVADKVERIVKKAGLTPGTTKTIREEILGLGQ